MIKTLFLTLSIFLSSSSFAHEPCREQLQPIGGYYTSHGWVPVRWVPTGLCDPAYQTPRPVYRSHPHTHYTPVRPWRPTFRIVINPRSRPRPSHNHHHRHHHHRR